MSNGGWHTDKRRVAAQRVANALGAGDICCAQCGGMDLEIRPGKQAPFVHCRTCGRAGQGLAPSVPAIREREAAMLETKRAKAKDLPVPVYRPGIREYFTHERHRRGGLHDTF